MNRQDKVSAIEALSEKFGKAPLALLADYRGLTVAQMTELRRKLAGVDGELLVAKNTLARLAIKDGAAAPIEPLLEGPSAIAFAYSDAVAVAKTVKSFADDNDALELKGAVLDGELLDVAKVKQLATMPGRDELRAKLLALLMTPATQLVRVLSAPAQQLVQVMEARRNSIEE